MLYLTTYEVYNDLILVLNVPAADRQDRPVFLNRDFFETAFKSEIMKVIIE